MKCSRAVDDNKYTIILRFFFIYQHRQSGAAVLAGDMLSGMVESGSCARHFRYQECLFLYFNDSSCHLILTNQAEKPYA